MSNFKFKKKYGQNFLKNDTVIEKIVNSITPSEKDLIIEIGPGGGVLTSRLKKYNAKLLAFEIDTDTKKFLSPLLDDKTEVLYEDFLSVDIAKKLKSYTYEKLYIIGNLPYYITTPIIEHIIDSKIQLSSLTIMVQKEVADRFLAKPENKEYGYMTVLLNYNFEIEKVIDAKPNDFVPAPKVSSTVIKLIPRKKEEIDYDKFKTLLKDSFQFKRKTINNNLKNYDTKKAEEVLKKYGHTLSSRAEELSLQEFIELTREFSNK